MTNRINLSYSIILIARSSVKKPRIVWISLGKWAPAPNLAAVAAAIMPPLWPPTPLPPPGGSLLPLVLFPPLAASPIYIGTVIYFVWIHCSKFNSGTKNEGINWKKKKKRRKGGGRKERREGCMKEWSIVKNEKKERLRKEWEKVKKKVYAVLPKEVYRNINERLNNKRKEIPKAKHHFKRSSFYCKSMN